MENQKIEEGHSHQEIKTPFNWGHWYDHNYKFLMIIPAVLLLISLVYLGIFITKTGDIFYKDVSLTGGTTITVYTEKTVNPSEIENAMKGKFNDVIVRILTEMGSGKQIAFTLETKAEVNDVKKAIEDYLGYALDEQNSSIEFTGTALSQSFSNELIRAILIAFVFMSVVIFILFKNPLPCTYVVLCAFSDIVIPLAIIDYLGIRISTAGIAAFLMLIGYSVDSDILLTTRVLKRRNEILNKRIFSSIKTGLTMTMTSFVAVLIAHFVVISPVLKQVFLILSIGLFFDMIVTWLFNAGLLKMYCVKRGIQ